MPAALLEELLEQVLFHIPPDDPASLVSAALVSKRWCRLICGRAFRRRFREFHGTPPLLGLVRQATELERFFVPSSSFRPRDHAADRRNLKAVHSCHGRVLLHSAPRGTIQVLGDLFLWDPITDKMRKLPRWQLQLQVEASYADAKGNASVLCAELGDGCDHLDCHRGPFLVVLAGIDRREQTFISVYSTEADRWSEPIYAGRHFANIEKGHSVLVGSAVYFMGETISIHELAILKYDLLTQEISPIHIPRVRILEHIKHEYIVLVPICVYKPAGPSDHQERLQAFLDSLHLPLQEPLIPTTPRAHVTRAERGDDWLPRRSARLAAKLAFRLPQPELQAERVMLSKMTGRPSTDVPDPAVHDAFL